ncbi:MAG: DUF2336 domain-containing protein [Pseudomonadota bacterium]
MSETGLSPAPLRPEDIDDPGMARRMVVRKLCDLVVLPSGRLTAHERAMAADVLLAAMEDCAPEQRLETAERLCRFSETAPALLRRLLLDDYTIAEPILKNATVLSDGLLAEAARSGEESHRLAVAQREDVTPALADMLIDFGETAVIEALLSNDMVRFAPASVDKLVARSKYVERIGALLLKREELEPSHAFAMFWWCGSELRRAILQRFSVDRRILQEALQDVFRMKGVREAKDPIVRDVVSLIDRRRRPRVKAGKSASPDAVRKTMEAARRKPDAELLQILAQLTGASRTTALRVLKDETGESLAVMCKALGVSRDGFIELLSGGQRRSSAPAADTEEAPEEAVDVAAFTTEEADYVLSVFDTLSHGFAQTIFRYWDWRGNPRLAGLAGLEGVADGGEAYNDDGQVALAGGG